MAQRDYEEHLGAPAGDRDGLHAGHPPPDRPHLAEEDEVAARGMQEGESLDAERIDRQPGSGGAAGVDGRRDAGPDAWR